MTLLEIFRSRRNLLLTEGIIFLILGILAIALPMLFTVAITLIFGCILIAAGVAQGVRLANMEAFKGKWLEWVFVAATLVTGILMIVSPNLGAITLTALLIGFFFVAGIAKIVFGFQSRDLPNWGWILVSGLLSLAMAAIIIAGWPGTALWVLGLLLGVNMLFFGFTMIGMARMLKV